MDSYIVKWEQDSTQLAWTDPLIDDGLFDAMLLKSTAGRFYEPYKTDITALLLNGGLT